MRPTDWPYQQKAMVLVISRKLARKPLRELVLRNCRAANPRRRRRYFHATPLPSRPEWRGRRSLNRVFRNEQRDPLPVVHVRDARALIGKWGGMVETGPTAR